jgi:outer membrane protein OmpU
MNNLKKIGLSALAGSLVAMSAYAAEVSLSGGASITTSQTNEDGKVSYGANDSITFSVSGETEGGIKVTNSIELDDSAGGNGEATDTVIMTMSYDGLGTVTYARHGGDSVLGGMDSVSPHAYEEVWDVTQTDAATPLDNNVINGAAGNGLFRYDSPNFSGLVLSASYDSTVETGAVGSYSDYGFTYSPEMVEGLTIGYAEGEHEEAANVNIDSQTYYVKYAYGPLTVAYQESEEDAATQANSNESSEWGVSYAVSDNFSISYGQHRYDDNLANTGDEQKSSGFAASYTMAGTTIAGSFNESDNVDSTANEDAKGFEITASFAF